MCFITSCNDAASLDKVIVNEQHDSEWNHIDSVAYFHNLVLEKYFAEAFTKSSEPNISNIQDISGFVDDVCDYTEVVLQENMITYSVDEEQREAICLSLEPFVAGLLERKIPVSELLLQMVDVYFSAEDALLIKAMMSEDFDDYEINMTKCFNNSIEESFYKIGMRSKVFHEQYITKGKVNGSAYFADGLGGAMSIIWSLSGPAAWFGLALSTAWSLSVDSYNPRGDVEWTNCD